MSGGVAIEQSYLANTEMDVLVSLQILVHGRHL